MNEKYIFLLAGIIIGWIIKAPFLIKYYRSIKKDREHMEKIADNFRRLN